jgi:outer membrane protein insertion porin family
VRDLSSDVKLEGNHLTKEDEFNLVTIAWEAYNADSRKLPKRFPDYFGTFGFAFARVEGTRN